MRRVVVTGAEGLIGWHASARLHAANCSAAFRGKAHPYEIMRLGHAAFDDSYKLATTLEQADLILHFAGVNRGDDELVKTSNPAIAERLVTQCNRVGAHPHIVYANSTHASGDTIYGASKRRASEILSSFTDRFTDLVLPHIFGEGARPYYNNVTATLIDQILKRETPSINPEGQVNLLHAGEAAQAAIDAGLFGRATTLEPEGRAMSVAQLFDHLSNFHESYSANIYPSFGDDFETALFNTFRSATYPDGWPRPLELHSDARGALFEAVKGGGGGQTFLSTTHPGVTRGDHFHLKKVERFLVVEGDAIIRMRRVLSDDVFEYRVSGKQPAAVDMPTLYTHSIENIGDETLLTLFWTHDQFDPERPDTYADKVLA